MVNMAKKKDKNLRLSYQDILNLKSEVYISLLDEAEKLFPAEYKTAIEESDKIIKIMEDHAKNLPAFHLPDYFYWLRLSVYANCVANEFNEYPLIFNGKRYRISTE